MIQQYGVQLFIFCSDTYTVLFPAALKKHIYMYVYIYVCVCVYIFMDICVDIYPVTYLERHIPQCIDQHQWFFFSLSGKAKDLKLEIPTNPILQCVSDISSSCKLFLLLFFFDITKWLLKVFRLHLKSREEHENSWRKDNKLLIWWLIKWTSSISTFNLTMEK